VDGGRCVSDSRGIGAVVRLAAGAKYEVSSREEAAA
jgi:hypothetical protein